jgi:hypothetical protein
MFAIMLLPAQDAAFLWRSESFLHPRFRPVNSRVKHDNTLFQNFASASSETKRDTASVET